MFSQIWQGKVKVFQEKLLHFLNPGNGYEWQSQVPRNHWGAPAQTRMAHTFELMDIVPPTPHDLPLPEGYTPGSDEGRLKLEELMATFTKLSKQVLDLEKEKDAQAVEILKLKKRVKKLERQRKSSISHPRRRIYRQVESSNDDLDEEDASKQRRKSDKTKRKFKDSDFDRLDDDMENVEGETVYDATSGVSTAGALVSTARPIVSTAGPSTSVIGTSTVVITNTEQEQRRLTTPPPSQPSDTRDKGKGIMVELDPPVKIKRIDQEYDTIQASIDADALFAVRLQQEERKQFTIKERTQFLVEAIAAQRKFRAAQRAAEIKSKPPTKTQLRNMMITYLKNMGKFNHNQLKGKEEKKLVEPKSEGKKGKRIKRVADSALKQKSSKKQKMMQEQESAKSDKDAAADYEHEKEELRMCTLTCFNMLVEKRYPLIKEILEKMLNWKLEAEAKSTIAFELFKFIKGGLLGIKDFYKLVLLVQLDTAGDG
ncbi:putative reverse transcriptase domain-containing protein [Tanacetum coccineum]